MRWRWGATFLLLLPAFGAPQKRAFTLADLYRLRRVGDPQVAPDGGAIVFTVTSYALAQGKRYTDLYLVRPDGSGLRRLTYHEAADYHPRFSPDGQRLLFVSTRSGSPQVYLLDLRGGEPRALTSFATGVRAPEWAGDGRHIVFSSRVFPEYGADDARNRRDLEAMRRGPIRAHLADRLLYRHWDTWQDGRVRHTFALEVATGKIRDLTPGDREAPRFSLGGGPGYAVSPDGREVCYVMNPDPDPWSSTNADLWVVPITGGKARNLTAANKAYDASPAYSPDGRAIAFRKQVVPRYESDRFRLALHDRREGTVRTLTEDFDRWVRDFRWAPDGRSLFFTADDQGHVPLFRVARTGGAVSLVADVKTIDAFAVSPDGRWVVAVRRSVAEPSELVRIDLTDPVRVTRITFFNRPVEEEVDLRPAEELRVPGADGKPVHVFLVKPHGFDPQKKYPLILNVHGGPQGMWADAFRGDWQIYPGAGYVVAFPNPHGSTGYGQAYTRAISRDWGGKIFVDLMKVTDALAKLEFVDPDRMGAMGWSYGGYMMMWFAGHTDRFKCLAAMMGVYDLRSMYSSTEELWFVEWDLGGPPWEGHPDYVKFSPSQYVQNFKTPCLVITGERDFRVPYSQSLMFFTDLQKMGVPSRLIVFQRDGHWPDFVRSMPLYYNAHLEWFHRWLGGAPAPHDTVKMVRNRAFEGAAGKGR